MNYIEYNSNASIDDGSCLTLIIEGCTDEFADNYNSNANLMMDLVLLPYLDVQTQQHVTTIQLQM